jgi:hypothetical protein
MKHNVNFPELDLIYLRAARAMARSVRKAINFRRYRRQYIRRSK